MKIKTKVAYVATVGEFYALGGHYLDGVIKRTPIYREIANQVISEYGNFAINWPDIIQAKKKTLLDRLKEKF